MGHENLVTIAKKGLAGLVLVGALGGCGALGYNYFVPDTIEAKVTGAEVKRYGGKDMYIVFTMDDEGETHVFRNTDAWYRLKFRSSDLQAEIEALEDTGITVEITKYGWRIPLLSKYENIINVERVDR